MWLEAIAGWIIFILPSYFANAVPVVFGGGQPIDGGRTFSDGRRLFGDGKTVRGFVAGVLAGTAIGAIGAILLPATALDIYGGNAVTYVLAGFLLGLGTMAGDLAGSFVKRRQGIGQGKSSLVLDQLSFLLFAFLFSYPMASRIIVPEAVVFLTVLTYFVHIGANILANRLGLKKVPW